MNYEDVLNKIENNEPFAFSRWGDGEWNCILTPDDSKANCDGHKYFHTLSAALKQVLFSKPKYYLGIQGHAMRTMQDKILNFQREHFFEHLEFSNADVFHHASTKGIFESFMKLLSAKENVILVGPLFLTGMPFIERHIEIAEKDCWLQHAETVNRLKTEMQGRTNCIVLFCAGMAANVMIDRMYYWNPEHTYLDMGSVFDPYAGRKSRSYHREIVKRLVFKIFYPNG